MEILIYRYIYREREREREGGREGGRERVSESYKMVSMNYVYNIKIYLELFVNLEI